MGENKYRGVSWHRTKRKWRVKLKSHGRDLNLGRFDNPETAARVYDCAAILVHGRGEAILNFDGEPPDEVPLGVIRAQLRNLGVLK